MSTYDGVNVNTGELLGGPTNRWRAGTTPAAGVIAALKRGMTTCIHLTGDSTGDSSGAEVGDREWFYRLGQLIGAKYPSYNVLWRQWDDATSRYPMPEQVQTGPLGRSYVTFAGTCGMKFTSPAAANITGDLDVIVEFRATNPASGAIQVLAAQVQASGNNTSWTLYLSAAGVPTLSWTPDGTAGSTISKAATTAYPIAADTWGVLRVQHTVSSGGNNIVRFYTASAKDGAYTQLGSDVTTAGATSHYASTAPYTIGSRDTSLSLPFAGDISWVEIRNGLSGQSVVPPLPSQWEQTGTVNPATCTIGGSPTLLMVGGSQAGQGISYFDNSTRRPKLFGQHEPQLIILSTGHNEANPQTQTWRSVYSTWITNIKALLPDVPICVITQNPIAASAHTTNDQQARSRRGVELMALARATAGVHGIDTYPAGIETTSDDVHPTAAGSTSWAAWMYDQLGLGL